MLFDKESSPSKDPSVILNNLRITTAALTKMDLLTKLEPESFKATPNKWFANVFLLLNEKSRMMKR